MFNKNSDTLSTILENSFIENDLPIIEANIFESMLEPLKVLTEADNKLVNLNDEEEILATARILMKTTFTKAVSTILKNLSDLSEKASDMIMVKGKYMSKILDRYDSQLHRLTEHDLYNIIYRRISYNINSNIPHRVSSIIVTDGIQLLQQRPVNRADIKRLKDDFKTELQVLRAGIIGGSSLSITDSNFESIYQSIFKTEDRSRESHMNKLDLMMFTTQIGTYPMYSTTMQRSFKALQGTLELYEDQALSILSNKHQVNADSLRLKSSTGKPYIIDSRGVGFHHEFQSRLIGCILTLINIYNEIFKYKVSMVHEKILYDQALLKQVTDYIDRKGG